MVALIPTLRIDQERAALASLTQSNFDLWNASLVCCLLPLAAVRMAAAAAEAALAAAPGGVLVTIAGGDKRNAIPRECSATIVVSGSCVQLVGGWAVLALRFSLSGRAHHRWQWLPGALHPGATQLVWCWCALPEHYQSNIARFALPGADAGVGAS